MNNGINRDLGSKQKQSERSSLTNEQWQRKMTKPRVPILKRLAQWAVLSVLVVFAVGVWSAALDDEAIEATKAKRAQQAILDRREKIHLATTKAESERIEQAAARQALCGKKSAEAYLMTQDRVRATLKAPSSAEFPWSMNISSKHLGDCKFNIRAYVDAQNSFGAMLRINYTAKMQYYPETKLWRTLSVRVAGWQN